MLANESLAEYAVDALVLHASDAALLAIDTLAIRYRTKFKTSANGRRKLLQKSPNRGFQGTR
jgi:hypothetical protein